MALAYIIPLMRARARASAWGKIAALFVALAAGLELLMRLAGFVLSAPSDRRNEVRPEDAGELRILALGESTTADYFSDEAGAAWPRRLERELRRAGVGARVYNEALGGTTSALIVTRLPEYLEKYRPQIVITMMGINDDPFLRYDDSFESRLSLSFSQIRLVKLGKWIADRIDAGSRCSIDWRPISRPEYYAFVERELASPEERTVAEVEKKLREQIPGDRDVALALTRFALKLRGDLNPNIDVTKSRAFIDRAFDLYPYTHEVAFFELNGSLPEDRCRQASLKLLECGRNLPDDLLSEIAHCAQHDAVLAAEPLFRSRNLLIARSEPVPRSENLQETTWTLSPTAQDYRILHEFLRRAGISHVAMQYPTLALDSLKAYFRGADGRIEEPFRDIVFVSNEENFAQALKSRPYDEIFRDRYKGSWGHTAGAGHQLIAEAALKAVLGLVRKTGP